MGFLGWLRRRLLVPGGSRAPVPVEPPESTGEEWEPAPGEACEHPISDTLDLHAFSPREAASAVREFLDVACAAGFAQIRIVHGKGIGVQRAMVRRILQDDPRVIAFGDAVDASGWGATVARLGTQPPPAPRKLS